MSVVGPERLQCTQRQCMLVSVSLRLEEYLHATHYVAIMRAYDLFNVNGTIRRIQCIGLTILSPPTNEALVSSPPLYVLDKLPVNLVYLS